MARKQKEPTEPTRRSTRVASLASTTTSTTTKPAAPPAAPAKKRVAEDKEGTSTAPAVKKAKKELGVGEKLPDISLLDEEGNAVKVVDITSEKGIILFAYPKASTPGCTKQACGFRDIFEGVSKKDYLIYGISKDPPSANKKFKENLGLQYHLLSDVKSELLSALGATKEGNKTLRSSWVIGKGGVIEDVQLGTSPADSVTKAKNKLGIE